MASSSRRANARRRLVVKPAFQWKVTLGVIGLFVLMGAATLWIVYYAFWSTLLSLELWSESVVIAVFNAAVWMVFVELSILLPILAMVILRMTNRIVGPIERMSAELRKIAAGNFDVSIRLRRGDLLVGMADTINDMAAALRRR